MCHRGANHWNPTPASGTQARPAPGPSLELLFPQPKDPRGRDTQKQTHSRAHICSPAHTHGAHLHTQTPEYPRLHFCSGIRVAHPLTRSPTC